MPASHSAGIKSLQAAKSPATFQAPPTEMLPVAPTAAANDESASPLPGEAGPKLHSSPILLDLQTSVSPMLASQPQPVAEDMMPMPGLTASEVKSPVALAPSSTAQSEAPTPTLLPRVSAAGSAAKEAVNGSPPVAPPVELAAESPCNIVSSLQQVNLQSRPFDLGGSAQEGVSPFVAQQTPEPESNLSDSNQQNAVGPLLEQTPEPSYHSLSEQVVLPQSKNSAAAPMTSFAAVCRCYCGVLKQIPKNRETRGIQHNNQQGATVS